MKLLYATGVPIARRKIIVTMMIDAATGSRPRAVSVDDEPLQVRAKEAGLSQKRLAELLGVTDNTASLQLRGRWKTGTPRYVIAVLLAWEMLPHADRVRWLREVEAVERELSRREGEKGE